jgi:hypothetical protein
MLIKISLMAEIADADADADTLREAALRDFDDADSTSPDHVPDQSAVVQCTHLECHSVSKR